MKLAKKEYYMFDGYRCENNFNNRSISMVQMMCYNTCYKAMHTGLEIQD